MSKKKVNNEIKNVSGGDKLFFMPMADGTYQLVDEHASTIDGVHYSEDVVDQNPSIYKLTKIDKSRFYLIHTRDMNYTLSSFLGLPEN